MYESVFINSNGSNIFTTIGALESLKDELLPVSKWNTVGSASLIVFFKCLGLNYNQTFIKFLDFSLINTFLNFSQIILEDENEKRDFIKGWLKSCIEESAVVNENTTLREIYKLTNISPSFIVWSRKNKKIITISPTEFPNTTLLDAVMATLCYIGTYSEYILGEETVSNITTIDCYPVMYSLMNGISDINTVLCIANITTYEKNYTSKNRGPFISIEEEYLKQYSEYETYKINNILAPLKKNNVVKLFSDYRRGDLSIEEKKTLYKIGYKQGACFISGEEPKKIETLKFLLDFVENQS